MATSDTDTDTGADTALVLTERIEAPADTIFDFLVDPQKMLRWMGSAVDIDPRPGGRFWLDVNGSDVASGTYVEVARPHRVVFTWGWEGSDDVPPGSGTVTISLVEQGDGWTEVELRHDGLPGGQDDPHAEGWGHYLPRLAQAASGIDPGPDSLHQPR